MNTTLEKLNLWGCDINGALERLVDDQDLYISCLIMFSEDAGFESLQQDIRTKNYAQAFEHAHTLKGVAANLGLTPIFDSISAVVEALRSQHYEMLGPLCLTLEKSFTQYQKLLEKDSTE